MVKDISVWACPETPTYECYPVQTGYSGPGAFAIDVPQQKILIAFGTSRNRESIFGYYQQTDGAVPTRVPGSRFNFDYPSQRGTVTRDRSKATLVDISGKTTDANGNLSLFVQLPPDLP